MVPYCEGILSPEQRALVEEHLKECPECSEDAASFKGIISALRIQRTCGPAPWQIYEWVAGGRPHGALAEHVRDCPECLREAEEYEPAALNEPLPASLWLDMRAHLPRTLEARRSGTGGFPRLRGHRLSIAAVAIAAIVTFAVVFIPERLNIIRGPGLPKPTQIAALSSEAWPDAFKPKAIRPKATVLIVNDPDEPVSQKEIDALYKSLEPNMDVAERYDMVAPARIKEASTEGKVDLASRTAALKDLAERLSVETVLFVRLFASKGDVKSAQLEKVDARSNQLLGATKVNEPTAGSPSNLASSVSELLRAQ